MRFIQPAAGKKHGNLIPEFERVVAESESDWFIMENVADAPKPWVAGYGVHSQRFDCRWLGEEQSRERVISFGHRGHTVVLGLSAYYSPLEHPLAAPAVCASSASVRPVRIGGSGKVKRALRGPTVVAGHGSAERARDRGNSLPFAEMVRLQGLPEGFLEDAPFTVHGKRKVVGNGVPLPMGRAIAQAVGRAMGYDLPEQAA